MKKILLGIMSLSVGLSMAASPLTPEEALSRVNVGGPVKMKSKTAAESPKLQHTFYDENGEAALYVFTYSGDKGFMLVSADNCARPLLGYSDVNSFDIPGVAPEETPLISQYVNEIGTARRQNAPAYAAANYDPSWEIISPMVKALYDQFAPYYNRVSKNATGCIATAMAEVMKYWEYPIKGRGTVNDGPKKLNLEENPFDWANMLDVYKEGQYNDVQAEAVALLMQACGWAMQLKYNTGGTGGNPDAIPDVMVKYFCYAPGATNYTYSGTANGNELQWNTLLYENLKNYGPVVYSDQTHTYVCDGYAGNGYFHFNFGWSGYRNGDYVPSATSDFAHDPSTDWHQFTAKLRPADAELTISKATVGGLTLSSEGVNYVENIANLDLNLDIDIQAGLIDSYIYMQIAKGNETVYKAILGDRITQQFGTVTVPVQLLLSNLKANDTYTLTLQYQPYSSDALATLGTYQIAQPEVNIENPWEGVPYVEPVDGNFTITLSNLKPNTSYVYTLYAVAGDEVSEAEVVTFKTQPTSGIEDLNEGDEPARYYNLQGIEVEHPTKGEIYIVRKGDKSYKIVF